MNVIVEKQSSNTTSAKVAYKNEEKELYNMSALITVNGYELQEINGEAVIKDTVLAERLGYKNTRDIRQLIKRMIEARNFGDALPCSIEEKPQNGGHTVLAYYLNEKQSLKVISKSETKNANDIMDQVLDVFIAWRNGKLQPIKTFEEQMRDTLLLADAKVKELQEKIEQDKPKVSLAESIQVSAGAMNISDWVRVLKDESGHIKQKNVFDLLREWRILFKQNKVNIPQAKYIDNGWFEVTENTIITPNGSKTKVQAKITGKGQVELSYRIKEYFKAQAISA